MAHMDRAKIQADQICLESKEFLTKEDHSVTAITHFHDFIISSALTNVMDVREGH